MKQLLFYKHINTSIEATKLQVSIWHNSKNEFRAKSRTTKGFKCVISAVEVEGSEELKTAQITSSKELGITDLKCRVNLTKDTLNDAVNEVERELPRYLEDLVKLGVLIKDGDNYNPIKEMEE